MSIRNRTKMEEHAGRWDIGFSQFQLFHRLSGQIGSLSLIRYFDFPFSLSGWLSQLLAFECFFFSPIQNSVLYEPFLLRCGLSAPSMLVEGSSWRPHLGNLSQRHRKQNWNPRAISEEYRTHHVIYIPCIDNQCCNYLPTIYKSSTSPRINGKSPWCGDPTRLWSDF